MYEFLVGEGVRTEFILGSLAMTSTRDKEDNDIGEGNNGEGGEEYDYLKSKLRYSEGLLLDADDNAVMMGWETPLMVKHCEIMCKDRPKRNSDDGEGFSFLNVGFGLGIIDGLVQKQGVGRHVIIEAHPDVYAHMISEGWNTKPGVEIFFGRWQDHIENVSLF